MPLNQGPFERLAECALALLDFSGIDLVCGALDAGRLNRDSTSTVRAVVSGGNANLDVQLRLLQKTWTDVAPHLSATDISLLLRTSAAAASLVKRQHPATQVVWTGPTVDGSYLRSTSETVRDLIRQASKDLLVVGYWIVARDDGEGIIWEVIASLAEAVRRGVAVTVIADERVRPDGMDNLRALKSAWPIDVAIPKVLTWRLPSDDAHLKLHAKVLVADKNDSLVTSANLTSYALHRNIEMGFRVSGRPAHDIATHFELLEAHGILGRFRASSGEM